MSNTPRDPSQKGRRNVGVLAGILLSFETGEQGAFKAYFPFKVQITKIRTMVVKALAATDSGTVTGANSTGNSTSGVTTHAASAALADEQSASPTTNIIVNAGDYYKLTPAKTTAGGKVLASIEYIRVE